MPIDQKPLVSGTRDFIEMLKKISRVFPASERSGLLSLAGLMILAAALETLGVALVFPLIQMFSEPDTILQNRFVSNLLGFFGIESFQGSLTFLSLLLILFFVAKNSFLAFFNFRQFSFLYRQHKRISLELLRSYLTQPYLSHLNQNSAVLLRNVNTETLYFINGVMVPLLSLVTELLQSIAIIAFLFAIKPWISLFALVGLGTVSVGFYLWISKATGKLGESYQTHSGQMMKWVNQGLGSFKLTKLRHREAFFLKNFETELNEHGRSGRYLKTIQQMPRLFLEVVTVVALFVLIYAASSQNSLESWLPALALFVMAAFRLTPSMNRIVQALTLLRFHRPTVATISEELMRTHVSMITPGGPDSQGPRGPSLSFRTDISLENLSFRYPGTNKLVLNRVNLKIPKNASVGIVGASGAGKSTLIDILLGLLAPTEGYVRVDSLDVQQHLKLWQNAVGYVPQSIYLMDDSIARNIAFGEFKDQIDEGRVWKALEMAQLKSFVESLPDGIHSQVGERGVRISGGQQQRIGIARALYHQPEVLVLDEATSSLDPQTEAEIGASLEALAGQKTLIVVAHRLSTVRRCDFLVFLRDGVLVEAASYDTLINHNQEFKRMAGISA